MIKLDFPIYTVEGDKYIDLNIDNIIKIKKNMIGLTSELKKFSNLTKTSGNKLNLYINNVLGINFFNFKKHIIIFNKNKELCIYTQEKIKKYIIESKYSAAEILENLPITKNKFKINIKQTNKCIELLEEYNLSYYKYEDLLITFDEYKEKYNEIICNIKERLIKTNFYKIEKEKIDNYELEPFEEEKHELIITQDKITSQYKIIYLNKSDMGKFIKYIDENNLQ